MKYFSIQRVKDATIHLGEFESKWVIVPLVLASNGVNSQTMVNIASRGKPGTTQFLSRFFSGSAIGLPDFGNGRNILRPKFNELKNSAKSENDLVIHQRANLWGSTYSSRGYREMRDRGELSGDNSDFKIEQPFIPKWEANLPATFHFEELLVWIYAFSGFPDTVNSWQDLFNDYQDRILSGIHIDSCFASRFNVNNGVSWPTDLQTNRPTNADFVEGLFPGNAVQEATSPTVVDFLPLPKPFLLLAGISGTGKSRFVRKQAQAVRGDGPENFCLVPVRPDWHEPSDLLGYVSHISGAPKYIATDFLRFVVDAWMDATQNTNGVLESRTDMRPHWLCLDEMNLAPVEQYFADYLSVLETREWNDGEYTCEPLLKSSVLETIKEVSTDSEKALFRDLFGKDAVLDGASHASKLWGQFLKRGIEIPPNLIVAGTVNMDETTHGFSRKVIDRALTLDFQEFFPNELGKFLSADQPAAPKTLGFPLFTQVDRGNFGELMDPAHAEDSVKFIQKLNTVLEGTPFQLAYRALNELLLAVASFEPTDKVALQAVWDDFLMQKVLPRIEGDSAKLKAVTVEMDASTSAKPLPDEARHGKGSILHQVYQLLQEPDMLGPIWTGEIRPDLLRKTDKKIDCRSRLKLEWMMRRLKTTHFTDFWC